MYLIYHMVVVSRLTNTEAKSVILAISNFYSMMPCLYCIDQLTAMT